MQSVKEESRDDASNSSGHALSTRSGCIYTSDVQMYKRSSSLSEPRHTRNLISSDCKVLDEDKTDSEQKSGSSIKNCTESEQILCAIKSCIKSEQSTSSVKCNIESEQNYLVPSPSGKTVRKFVQWDHSETMVFYEGLKRYGKDVDTISKLMIKRKKLNKDKEQIRNYYFNSLKFFRSISRIDSDSLDSVPRDVKELFIVINGFEWKRKIGNKFDQSKFLQLILEGCTCVRVKGKKQAIFVRTPACRSLAKLFPHRIAKIPFPPHVTLCLHPKTTDDRLFVESCSHNPFIKIRLPINEQIGRVFSILYAKWIQKLGQYENEEIEPVNIALFPSITTRLENITARCIDDTSSSGLSLNRLEYEYKKVAPNSSRKDREDAGENELNCDTECRLMSSEFSGNDYAGTSRAQSNCSDSNILDEIKLRNGLTKSNVGNAAISELFYVCGKETEILMEYSVVTHINNCLKPWKLFAHLIRRGYAQDVSKILDEPWKFPSESKFGPVPSTLGCRRSRKRFTNSDEELSHEAVGERNLEINAELNHNVEVPQTATIVEAEMDAFIKQLIRIENKKRPNRSDRSERLEQSFASADAQAYDRSMGETNAQHHSAQGKRNYRRNASGRRSNAEQQAELPCSSWGSGCDSNRPINSASYAMLEKLSRNELCGNTNDANNSLSGRSIASLPDDIRQSYEVMLQQNSVDFFTSFEQLINMN